MPSALVAALAAPIHEVQALVGPGWSSDPFGAAHNTLAGIAAASQRAWSQAEMNWSGTASDAAAEFAATTIAAANALAQRVGELGATAQNASAAVARARERLGTIVEEFEARAAALEPYLDSPGGVEGLMAEARRSLEEAVAVVEELRSDLDGHAAALSAPAAPSSPAATTPAGMGSASMPSMPSLGSGFGGSAPMSPMSGMGGAPGPDGADDLARFASHDAPLPDAAAFGDGFAVRLPDGSTALAPNAVAASAVRHALTQLGVPYQWGGTAPGVGLDCSGLTQWAYHEAGLNIPRLAQEQDIGAAVNAGSLRPGDLAVWDGHVAMIVGNGTMIETRYQ
ncbi:cell wall-associated hydrolase, invasion-associated protein [Mycobacterium sp. JS623]|uniref:C40 family peptidase n=1 Tax=Mycobacterium sp. JS623 TaxID=212767 RepID=UPI0002A5B994|nr:C40 family peptidase [Mycobacterium sp. JS623]AGB21693.1 cell wall-associated hydrolase, invasion-associated protein [Mycobacterium sp. JS623]